MWTLDLGRNSFTESLSLNGDFTSKKLDKCIENKTEVPPWWDSVFLYLGCKLYAFSFRVVSLSGFSKTYLIPLKK